MLSVFDFGKELLKAKDLDPVYTLLWEAELPRKQLQRWLLAYWCFYHVGTASWISEAASESIYWKRMQTAAASKEYPRCPERRHFRGENAWNSVDYLRQRGVVELFSSMLRARTCEEVMREVQTWVGFGPWISFKIADMLERLDLAPIAFSTDDVYLFDSPKKAAETMREELKPDLGKVRLEAWAVDRILGEIRAYRAPPRFERKLGPQEAETILCKWKSYLNGKYRVGEDVDHSYNGLLRFLRSKTSQKLIKAGRQSGLWG